MVNTSVYLNSKLFKLIVTYCIIGEIGSVTPVDLVPYVFTPNQSFVKLGTIMFENMHVIIAIAHMFYTTLYIILH